VKTFERIYSKIQHWGILHNYREDSESPQCTTCNKQFTFFNRRHHCRSCGAVFCVDCLALRYVPNYDGEQMVCMNCWKKMGKVIVKTLNDLNDNEIKTE